MLAWLGFVIEGCGDVGIVSVCLGLWLLVLLLFVALLCYLLVVCCWGGDGIYCCDVACLRIVGRFVVCLLALCWHDLLAYIDILMSNMPALLKHGLLA